MNKFEKGNFIGAGSEKIVFEDAKNPDRVIAEFHNHNDRESRIQLKGRYYLTKILRMLLPRNLPDIYPIPTKLNSLNLEKIEITPEMESIHDKIYEYWNYSHNKQEIPKELVENFANFRKKIYENPDHEHLRKILEICGLGKPDGNLLNYTFGKDGELKYFDNNFIISEHTEPIYKLKFNPEGLEEAIKMLDHKDREQAMMYFAKLMKWVKKDGEEYNKELEKRNEKK